MGSYRPSKLLPLKRLRGATEKIATNIIREGQMRQLLWLVAAFALATSTAWAGKKLLPPFLVHSSAHGDILADADGMTLYTFDGDARYGPKCITECATAWRPFTVPGGYSGIGYWTVITRADGVVQWAYGGKPLYTYRGDLVPGDINGERQRTLACCTRFMHAG